MPKRVKLYASDDVLENFYEVLLSGNPDAMQRVHIPKSDVFYVRAKIEQDLGVRYSLDRIERAMYLEKMLSAKDVFEPHVKRDWEIEDELKCKDNTVNTPQWASFMPYYETLTPILVALVGSAGLWSFLAQRNKLQHDREQESEARIASFNSTLSAQVAKLSDKIDVLTQDKERLLLDMADLKAQLAEAHTTIKHLEELLRHR